MLLAVCVLVRPSTWYLVGSAQLWPSNKTCGDFREEKSSQKRTRKMIDIALGVDAITWVSQSVQSLMGTHVVIIFTGLSILPPNISLGDCVVRGIAAMYIRWKSPAFRKHMQVESASHGIQWMARGAALLYGLHASMSSPWMMIQVLFGSASLAITLKLIERMR